MAARHFAPSNDDHHQQSSAVPHLSQSWSWDAVRPASPSPPGRRLAIQQLTLPPMNMQHDLDADIDSVDSTHAEQSANLAFAASRSSFLAHILNSGDDASDSRPSAVAAPSSRHPELSNAPSSAPPLPADYHSPNTQPGPRIRSGHGYVDLTREQTPPISQERSTLRTLHAAEIPFDLESADSPIEPVSLSSSPMPSAGRRKRQASSPLFVSHSPSPKRAKRDNGNGGSGTNARRGSIQQAAGSGPSNTTTEFEEIERIDLIDDDTPLAEALQKQRAEQVKAQQQSQNGADAPQRLSNLTCVICMDTPKDLTATACGHFFCHTCLMEALIAGEARAGPGEPKRSQCPVCRKALSRNKSTDIIPILFKQRLATQPRRQKVVNTTTTPA